MSICQDCGKKSGKGNLVSFSAKKTNRRFKPNLIKIKVRVAGKEEWLMLCAKCLKKRRRQDISDR